MGKDVGGEEREGKDMAAVQGDESVKQDSQTDIYSTYHELSYGSLRLTKKKRLPFHKHVLVVIGNDVNA